MLDASGLRKESAQKVGAYKSSIGHRVIPSASAAAECGWWVGGMIILKSGLLALRNAIDGWGV